MPTVSYVRGLSLVAAVQDEVPTYYHYNAHGDVVQLTNSSGTVTKDYTYDAFGVEKNASASDANPFRYCGEQYDTETGNYYLRARYYSPGVGRFTQEDPIMDGLNWYTYCAGNPVAFEDSSGCIIELSGEATNDQRQQYKRAIEYIQTSQIGQKLINILEESEITFNILFVNDDGDAYSSHTHSIKWDAYSGLILDDQKSVQSPALGLAHEMGHAAQDLAGQLKRRPRSIIEEENLNQWETPIAKELGEYTRIDYFATSGKYKRTENSTEWGSISYNIRPWWHYIFIWNWFDIVTFQNENAWTPTL